MGKPKLPNIAQTIPITDHLNLSPVRADDIHFMYEALSDPRVVRYYGYQCNEWSDALVQMEWYDQLVKTGRGCWWILRLSVSNIPIGAIGINDLDPTNLSAEIGFWLTPDYWGFGHMHTCLKGLLDYLFDKIDLNILYAEVENENVACIRLLQKSGFQLVDEHDRKPSEFAMQYWSYER